MWPRCSPSKTPTATYRRPSSGLSAAMPGATTIRLAVSTTLSRCSTRGLGATSAPSAPRPPAPAPPPPPRPAHLWRAQENLLGKDAPALPGTNSHQRTVGRQKPDPRPGLYSRPGNRLDLLAATGGHDFFGRQQGFWDFAQARVDRHDQVCQRLGTLVGRGANLVKGMGIHEAVGPASSPRQSPEVGAATEPRPQVARERPDIG